ncbi:Phage capsid family [Campylobacter hyointestinalis subsp. hyointestinalis]|uniref:Phage capsid family n=1 Tax=Campylobacter hyointestinalis subsp. hyointestinalis TaxID=91352 RepID=A0A0S4SD80_CAMHY|nr:P2 family phage major capsid protein [Campylobacter hyointestinalis]CUU83347.1 Phage capsid family [Campylobacter hyointestinalis subsp. hyointestinalis]
MSKNLSQILKSTGNINATDMYANGSLRPEVANRVIKTIIDKSDFLSKVTIDRTKKLNKSFDTWNLASGILVRVSSGEKPNDSQRQKIGVSSVLIENKPVQLFAKITQDTLEDNADNPNFENETFNSFATSFSNDLQNLGMIGVKDDYEESKFENLNKGWFSIAKESSGTKKLEHKTNSVIINRLIAMVENANEDTLNESVIIMSKKDLIEYNKQIGNKNGGLGILLNKGADNILGVPLLGVSFVKSGEYMLTPLKNLIFSIGLDIRRQRWYDNEESSLKYKFEVFCDYQIGVPSWVVLSTTSDSDTDGDGV